MLFRFEIQAYNIRGKILILFSLLNLSNHAVGISVGRIPAFIGNDNFISVFYTVQALFVIQRKT